MGGVALVYINIHQIRQNNALVFNKRHQRPWLTEEAPDNKILSNETINAHSLMAQSSNPETGLLEKWHPYVNPWLNHPY